MSGEPLVVSEMKEGQAHMHAHVHNHRTVQTVHWKEPPWPNWQNLNKERKRVLPCNSKYEINTHEFILILSKYMVKDIQISSAEKSQII